MPPFLMLDTSEGPDGKIVVEKRRKFIAANENRCGRFAVITTSELSWKDCS